MKKVQTTFIITKEVKIRHPASWWKEDLFSFVDDICTKNLKEIDNQWNISNIDFESRTINIKIRQGNKK